jgi:RimJ/RimL family protein N-acetyltransferase
MVRMVTETERLVLRCLTPEDATFILGLLNEPSFIENIGDRGVRTLEAARGYLEQGPIASYRDNGYGLYMVERRDDGAQLGICGLVKRPYLDDADIGFAFLPAYWAQGYALEASLAVMAHARDPLGLARVLAIVSPGNQRSIRLLRKLGLEYQRTMDLPPPGGTVEVFGPP